jgi:hypothetical protein
VRVLAIERDRWFVAALQEQLEREGLAHRVQLRRGDLREVPLPRGPYRVVANPPFGLTTTLLARLLDDPERGPSRADLLPTTVGATAASTRSHPPHPATPNIARAPQRPEQHHRRARNLRSAPSNSPTRFSI